MEVVSREVVAWAYSDLVTGNSRGASRTDNLKYGTIGFDLVASNSRVICRTDNLKYGTMGFDLVASNSRGISRTDNLKYRIIIQVTLHMGIF